mmetsp:Transcript_5160/g.8919  ORF Transcript_5160/g.8919 Transcript_5160/m.8919 type:complete len:275 (-) Transcript_5160:453-1277(-)
MVVVTGLHKAELGSIHSLVIKVALVLRADITVRRQLVKDTVPLPVLEATVKEATAGNKDMVRQEDIPIKQATAKAPPGTDSTAPPAMARAKASPATHLSSPSTPPLNPRRPSPSNQQPKQPWLATECSKRLPQPALASRLPARPLDTVRQPRPGTASSSLPAATRARCPKPADTEAMGKHRGTTAAKSKLSGYAAPPRSFESVYRSVSEAGLCSLVGDHSALVDLLVDFGRRCSRTKTEKEPQGNYCKTATTDSWPHFLKRLLRPCFSWGRYLT